MEKTVQAEPKWLEIAREDLGVEEISGPQANPRVMAYFKAAKANWVKDDATPWCGAAMAAWVVLGGYAPPAEAVRARAWLDWGIPLEKPRVGCVCVLQRGNDEKSGHVTLWLEDRGDRFLGLGGNQGDAVSITAFPKRDILGYRWPPAAEIPANVPAVPVALPPARPLKKSGTVRAAIYGAFAWIGLQLEAGYTFAMDAVAQIVTFGPVKTAALEMGANHKAVMLGIGAYATSMVLSRRVKADVEGRAA
jgi:uncharacterized protein (TIGR02594 family)